MRPKNLAIVSTAALLLVGGYFVLLTPVEGQEQPPPPDVFTPVDSSGWVDPLLPDDAILRSRPVTININTLELVVPPDPNNPNAAMPTVPIRFNLFEDVSVTVVFDKAKPRYDIQIPDNPFDLLGQEFEPVGYTWSGDIVGDHQGHVVMVTKGGVCAVNISVPGVGRFRVRRSGDLHVAREIGGSSSWECGMIDDGTTVQSLGAGAGGSAGCDDGSTIDLMLFYTTAAKDAVAGDPWFADIEMEIDLAIGDTNAIYRNSAISTTLRRLSKVELVDYGEFGVGNLCRLATPWNEDDGDKVHPIRDALRADLVSLIVASGGSFGFKMLDNSPFSEHGGFSVVQWNDGGEELGLLLPHELGHNMGCAHDRVTDSCTDCNPPCNKGIFPYSFGYKFLSLGTRKTVMAKGFGMYIDHYSNPNVLFNGQPTGIPAESPNCDSADNALTINTTRTTIANFRETCDTTDTTTMASFDFFGGQGNGASQSVSISDNGQIMAFASDAVNLVEQEPFAVPNVFVYNRESGVVSPVSLNTDTQTMGDGASIAPAVSGNRHFVAFSTDATDLITGLTDDNSVSDIYVFDLFEPLFGCNPAGGVRMVRVSVDSNENQATGGASFSPSITFNGRFVVFASTATDLVPDDDNEVFDIFVRDRNGDEDLIFDEPIDSTTFRVSLSTLGAEGNEHSGSPSISANDGRFIAFESLADNLLDGGTDTNDLRDIFVRDTAVPASTFRVSVSTAGVQGDGPSLAPSISGNGQLVAFESHATNLVTGDTLGHRDIFVRNTDLATTIRVSDPPGPIEANGASRAPVISTDGRFVAFQSDASNLLGAGVDTNGQTDVFVYDLQTGVIFRPNISSGGAQATGGGSFAPAISSHGRFIAFESDATNLVPVDVGGFRDIFFRDRGTSCVADFNGDNVVDGADLIILLAAWGPVVNCPQSYIVPDLVPDCTVGPLDLATFLVLQGPCP